MPLGWVKQINIVPFRSKCLEWAAASGMIKREGPVPHKLTPNVFHFSQGYLAPLQANGATLSEH